MKTILEIEQTAALLKLLGDKTRLSIIGLLEKDTCCVCELVEIFQMTQPAISQHLRKLRDAGLVREKRQGQWMFYSLNMDHAAYPLIKDLLEFIPDQKEKLEALEVKGLRINCC